MNLKNKDESVELLFTCRLVLSCVDPVPSNKEAASVQSESDGDTEGGALNDQLRPSAPYKAEETNTHAEQKPVIYKAQSLTGDNKILHNNNNNNTSSFLLSNNGTPSTGKCVVMC